MISPREKWSVVHTAQHPSDTSEATLVLLECEKHLGGDFTYLNKLCEALHSHIIPFSSVMVLASRAIYPPLFESLMEWQEDCPLSELHVFSQMEPLMAKLQEEAATHHHIFLACGLGKATKEVSLLLNHLEADDDQVTFHLLGMSGGTEGVNLGAVFERGKERGVNVTTISFSDLGVPESGDALWGPEQLKDMQESLSRTSEYGGFEDCTRFTAHDSGQVCVFTSDHMLLGRNTSLDPLCRELAGGCGSRGSFLGEWYAPAPEENPFAVASMSRGLGVLPRWGPNQGGILLRCAVQGEKMWMLSLGKGELQCVPMGLCEDVQNRGIEEPVPAISPLFAGVLALERERGKRYRRGVLADAQLVTRGYYPDRRATLDAWVECSLFVSFADNHVELCKETSASLTMVTVGSQLAERLWPLYHAE